MEYEVFVETLKLTTYLPKFCLSSRTVIVLVLAASTEVVVRS
jgi:hypothetical protein